MKKIAILALALFAAANFAACENRTVAEEPSKPTEIVEQPQETNPDPEQSEQPSTELPEDIFVEEDNEELVLDQQLKLNWAKSYTGVFMEDGSNEFVTNAMSIKVTNNNENDLQLARFEIGYDEKTYHFEVTNLPAGSSAILIEKNRESFPDGEMITVAANNITFFNEPMDIHEDVVDISGMKGALNVKNISSSDIAGDIYIYYKYITDDVYYGGITFRTKVSGGLKSGELKQVMTGHYNPDTCKITTVTYGE